MRVFSVILVALAMGVAIATWLEHDGAEPSTGRLPPGAEILIRGPDNTLESIARQVGDAGQFSYDPASRKAVSRATLIIEGELRIGRSGEPDTTECLELATETCGDLRIEVRPSGALHLDHAIIRTVSQVLSSNACSRGYALFVDGKLTMQDSRISYLSGSSSQCLRRGAQAVIRQSTFSRCDGSALSCFNVDGRAVIIDSSEILGSGNWGLVVQGGGEHPLEVRNSVLDGQLAAVFLSGDSSAVRLVDCTFERSKIQFNQPSGQVIIAWSRRLQVLDGKTGRPLPGLLVQARCTIPDDPGRTVESRTDFQGMADVILTESIIHPPAGGAPSPANAPATYQISVLKEDGKVLAAIPQLTARGKDSNPVVIRLQ